MILKCITNKGSYPPLVVPYDINKDFEGENFVVSKDWYTIDATIVGYTLTQGREYQVYGILISNDDIRYLVADDNNIPCFFPSGLFSVVENYICFDWQLTKYNIDNQQYILIGYSRLTSGYEDFRDLIGLDPAAIRKFIEYKDSI